MKYIEGVCQQCGKTFSYPEKEKNRKYCSLECFHAGRRAPGRRCAVCGKKIDPRRGKTVRCCSQKCAGVLKIREGKVRKKSPPRMVERVCKLCGKTFTVPHTSYRTLCSSQCVSEVIKRKSDIPGDERTCPQCGKVFAPPKRFKKTIFCSEHCANLAAMNRPADAPMVNIRITEYIPVYEKLRPKVGQVYQAQDHRPFGVPMFIIPDICGRKVIVRENECEVVGE